MHTTSMLRAVLLAGSALVLSMGCASSMFTMNDTPGRRFERAMKELAKNCARHPPKPNDTACDILKLKPADPLATEAGRFAHSIQIPDPLPADSGYQPGMTPQEYFDHLCKTEAGEFIYKTVENVEGLYMMRPRKEATDDELEHLYALEDPYGHENWEAIEPGAIFVHPRRYSFLELPVTRRLNSGEKGNQHSLPFAPPHPDLLVERSFGYDGHNRKSMQKTYVKGAQSSYGFTWRGVHRPHDREMGIAGGELIVIDLKTSQVLGVRRGYMLAAKMNNMTGIWWMTGKACPVYNIRRRNKDFDFAFWFIGKVLKPKAYRMSSIEERGHAN